MGFTRNDETLKGTAGDGGGTFAGDEKGAVERLRAETGLSAEEAAYYFRLVREGSSDASKDARVQEGLHRRGMVILSGDGERVIPVHPRLGLANQYRTWREGVIREMNEKRMRMDKLILELIPLWEAATEKRTRGGGHNET